MSTDELAESLDRAAEMLSAAERVCVLTGAGVSAESGVPTFRASDGLWEGHRIEDVATPMGWRCDCHQHAMNLAGLRKKKMSDYSSLALMAGECCRA